MGDTGDTFMAAVNTGAFLLCVSFIAYVLLIMVPFLRRRRARPGATGDFEWHFVIPCLDEEAVIEDTVTTLLATYPTAHVWCVDDASTDATPAILARLTAASTQVHTVTRRLPDARRGKGLALNAAWHAIRASRPAGTDTERVIVGVVDADGRLGPDCLDLVAGPSGFADPHVGAVQIQVRMVECVDTGGRDVDRPPSSVGRGLVRLQDLEFSSVIAAIQTMRHHIGSVSMGGNGQFTRLAVLDRIAAHHGTPWHGALLEDLELGLHVLLTGSRTEYLHDAWVAQQALRSVPHLVRQRSRWAQGSMQCVRYLWPVLRSPTISTAGAVEISYFLLLPWLQLLGSVLYLVCFSIMAWYAVTLPSGVAGWFSSGAWGLAPLFVCFGLGPLVVWGPLYRRRSAPELSLGRSVALGIANWPYSYVHYAAVWWAFARVVRNRGDWKKTTRAVAADAAAYEIRSDDLPHGVLTVPVIGRFEFPAHRPQLERAPIGVLTRRPVAPATPREEQLCLP